MSISYGRVRGPGYDARTGKIRYKYAQGADKIQQQKTLLGLLTFSAFNLVSSYPILGIEIQSSGRPVASVTRLVDLLDSGQLFKAFGSN